MKGKGKGKGKGKKALGLKSCDWCPGVVIYNLHLVLIENIYIRSLVSERAFFCISVGFANIK